MEIPSQKIKDESSVIGRSPSDAVVEVVKLLGGAAPYLVILAIVVYGWIEFSKMSDNRLEDIEKARANANAEYKQMIDDLNSRLRDTATDVETLRKSQVETLEKVLTLNKSVLDSVFENQEKNSSQQKKLLVAETTLQEAQKERNRLDEERRRLEKEIWAADDTIDQAKRLANFVTYDATPKLEAGYLAERFENADPKRISRDREGKYYYGTYRLTADNIRDFIAYLKKKNLDDFVKILDEAGGYEGARNGTEPFRTAWIARSDAGSFNAAQKAFIKEHEYGHLFENLKPSLDIAKRSVALQSVILSVAVQYGRNTHLIRNALAGEDPSKKSDAELIQDIFNERRKIDSYFKHLDEATKELLIARYKLEEREAMKMLELEKNTANHSKPQIEKSP